MKLGVALSMSSEPVVKLGKWPDMSGPGLAEPDWVSWYFEITTHGVGVPGDVVFSLTMNQDLEVYAKFYKAKNDHFTLVGKETTDSSAGWATTTSEPVGQYWVDLYWREIGAGSWEPADRTSQITIPGINDFWSGVDSQ